MRLERPVTFYMYVNKTVSPVNPIIAHGTWIYSSMHS